MPKVSSYFPVDTGRKLNVHKTFKGRPGRLLNVLCTLNLRPVSTGQIVAYHLDYIGNLIYRFITSQSKSDSHE